jgi:S-adenosylmethionine decarboxylase
MAYNDTLFQLGMDLTRSSPAQKEEYGEVAQVVAQQSTKIIERESGRFAEKQAQSVGTQVTIDVYGTSELDNLKHVETTLTRCVEAASATLQHLHLHSVSATGGISGVAVLDDGHIAFHSRPDAGYAALDISTFGSCETQRWVAAAKAAFGQCQIVSRVRARGEVSGPEVTRHGERSNVLRAVLPVQRPKASYKPARVKAA